jgi:cell division protein FtsL
MATAHPALDTEEDFSDSEFYYDGICAGRAERAGLSRRAAASRPLPMEDLCFFVKNIDNSRLVRVLDPHSRRDCVKMVGFVSALCLLGLLSIVPSLSLRYTGYRIEDLKREQEALAKENRQLQVQEAVLREPKRIDAIARGRLGMQPALPEQVAWPDAGRMPRPDGRELLARNLSRFAAEGTR